jgi:hypothetical protein
VGSPTPLGTMRLGKRTGNRMPKIEDFVPFAGMEALVFGGWDAFLGDAYEAAVQAGVLEKEYPNAVRDQLTGTRPFPAVCDPSTSPGSLDREAAHTRGHGSLGEASEQIRGTLVPLRSRTAPTRSCSGRLLLDGPLHPAPITAPNAGMKATRDASGRAAIAGRDRLRRVCPFCFVRAYDASTVAST